MPRIPSNPSGLGSLQQKAAELRAQAERTARMASGPAPASQESTTTEDEQTEQAETCTPVGGGDYVVKPGDCISSIAKEKGHFWDTIWNDGGNAELKEARKEPNVLYPGDKVVIPEKEQKQEPGATEQRHRFCRKGEPTYLRLRILDQDEPRANEPYTLLIGGERREGTTDKDGYLSEPIPGNAREAKLIMGGDEYKLQLGHLDPVSSVAGVQQRLNNLGFGCGKVDGIFGPRTKGALSAFRRTVNLEPAPQIDDEVRSALEREHDEMKKGTGPNREAPPEPEDSLAEPDLDDPDEPVVENDVEEA